MTTGFSDQGQQRSTGAGCPVSESALSLGLGKWLKEGSEVAPKADEEGTGGRTREEGKAPNTRVRDVVPVRRVKLVLGLQNLFKEFGIILVIEGGITAEPRQGETHPHFHFQCTHWLQDGALG